MKSDLLPEREPGALTDEMVDEAANAPGTRIIMELHRRCFAAMKTPRQPACLHTDCHRLQLPQCALDRG